MESSYRESKTIVFPCPSLSDYIELVEDTKALRTRLIEDYKMFPELFPLTFEQGFHFVGRYSSAKLGVSLRRIRLKSNSQDYQLRPSCLLSYLRAKAEDVEDALFLRRWNVPFWALTHLYGRNDMFWYRLEKSFGHLSIVGTTVKKKENLPEDVLADEKHTTHDREKVFVATTAAKGAILGASLATQADEAELGKAYGEFVQEAKQLDPDYAPKTVNTDGWKATQNVWESLFQGIHIILCFLHSWLKIRDCSKRQKEWYSEVGEQVWEAYHAPNKASFRQRLRRLREWAEEHVPEGRAKSKILALCKKGKLFVKSYDHPSCYRTSAHLDRLMDFQDRALFSMRGRHGTEENTQLVLRSKAILHNFSPYSPRTLSKGAKEEKGKVRSPFEGINGYQYSENWLQNLLISSSIQDTYRLRKNR